MTEHMSTHQGLEKTGVGFLAHGTRCFKSTSDGGVGVTKEDIYFFFWHLPIFLFFNLKVNGTNYRDMHSPLKR